MAFFNEFPHTRTYDNDLGWIIKTVKALEENLQNFIKLNTVKYANPIQWDISNQYESNTVVIDALTGVAYISTQPVPTGVNINNKDYWTPVFTLDLVNLNKNITLRNDGNNHTATFESVVGDWIIVGGQLYRVTRDIGVHTPYVVGFNIEIFTVELFVKDYLNQLLVKIGDLQDLDTKDKTSVVNAINSVLSDLNTKIDNAIDSLKDDINLFSSLNGNTDTEKFQYAMSNGLSVKLDDDIILNNINLSVNNMHIYGEGHTITLNGTITGSTQNLQNYWWHDIVFTGSGHFNCDLNLLNQHFINCAFVNHTADIFTGTEMQVYTFDNCYFDDNANITIVNVTRVDSVSFSQCNIENGNHNFIHVSGNCYGLQITDSTIEGLTGTAVYMKTPSDCAFNGIYLESNYKNFVIEQAYTGTISFENIHCNLDNSSDYLLEINLPNGEWMYGTIYMNTSSISDGRFIHIIRNSASLQPRLIICLENLRRGNTTNSNDFITVDYGLYGYIYLLGNSITQNIATRLLESASPSTTTQTLLADNITSFPEGIPMLLLFKKGDNFSIGYGYKASNSYAVFLEVLYSITGGLKRYVLSGGAWFTLTIQENQES